ncbi:proteasome core particle subunit alpha 4 [Starmerella bacillaris]|uniref:Proteasome subunit alpha type n=1 Tax=Starmerella bacillaris TaxID=1247836 RepID=A0AAV5RIE1_STABA|nr:proteasome core particle subunit alpha 4 [Starmerella bacillaris]
MSGYDRALSVFSPDGHVFQVEYALEAVKRGTCAVGVKGRDVVVLGCERRSALKLHDPRTTPSKLCAVDDHITLCFAGLNADARVLVDRARLEAQNHRINLADPASVEYITKHIAGLQQRYTQSGGVRPFGISTLIGGFDPQSDKPNLYHTEPSGIFSSWKANAIGRSSKTVHELLDKLWEEDMDEQKTVELAVKSLLEVVQTGNQNIEVAVLRPNKEMEVLADDYLDEIVRRIEDEKAKEAEEKQSRRRHDD